MAMFVCPNCKHVDFGGSEFETQKVVFCSRCGTKLEKAPELPKCNCGNRMYSDQKFCTGCGLPREEALKKDEDPPRAVPMYGVKVPIPREDPPLVTPAYGVRRK